MALNRIFKGYSTVEASSINDSVLYDIDLIKRDITNHFSIKRGEKLENPNFGTTIPWLLFEPFSDEIEKAIEEDVINIFTYDPRVRLNVVEVLKDYDRQSITVNCEVTYVPFNITDGISWEFGEDGTIIMLSGMS
jgi:phage baseplate assembly protein W